MTAPAESTRRLMRALAAADPRRPAVSARDAAGQWHTVSRAEIVTLAEGQALRLRAAGGGPHTVVALGNGVAFLVAVLASWWSGRTPLIVAPRASAQELEVLFAETGVGHRDLLGSDAAFTVERTTAPDGAAPALVDVDVPDEPAVGWQLPSGGTTSLPRLIPIAGRPGELLAGHARLMAALGWRPGATQLLLGSLTHAAPFTCALAGLLHGDHLVVVDRFGPAQVRDAVRREPPTWCQLTPHQMAVVAADPRLLAAFGQRLTGMMHTAAHCPEHVKRAWIGGIGPGRVFELYGSTQMVGAVISDGEQWLARPGTVGRPYMTQVRVFDESGVEAPAGQVGEVFLRTAASRRLTPAQRAHLRGRPGGWFSVGDLGYLDDGGFLYLVDRVDDVIIVGGGNVNAREVELALVAHPAVAEAVVVGRPDRLLGQQVHAVVAASDPADPPTAAELRAHCAQRLADYKVPAVVEVVDRLERSHAGKVQRFRYR